MDDALLYFCLRIYRLDCLGESGKPVHAGDQDVVHAPVYKPVYDGKPEPGAFVLACIHAKDILPAIHVNPQRYVNGPFYNPPLAA